LFEVAAPVLRVEYAFLELAETKEARAPLYMPVVEVKFEVGGTDVH
jgi:hypothetical protein